MQYEDRCKESECLVDDGAELMSNQALKEDCSDQTREKTWQTNAKLTLAVVGSMTLMILAIWARYSLLGSHHPYSRIGRSGIIRRPCGNSVSEAKDKGCTFDPLSFCWLPEECLDHEMTEKFLAAGPEGGWKWYLDANRSAEIPLEQFGMDHDQHVWLTNQLHRTHCAFSWLKFHTAMSKGQMVHKENMLMHTEHCSKVISEDSEPQKLQVRAKIQFPDCGYFSLDFPGQLPG